MGGAGDSLTFGRVVSKGRLAASLGLMPTRSWAGGWETYILTFNVFKTGVMVKGKVNLYTFPLRYYCPYPKTKTLNVKNVSLQIFHTLEERGLKKPSNNYFHKNICSFQSY